MGELANDMIDGCCCSICGEYFVEEDGETMYEHGYPVACKQCWDEDCGYQKATADTI